MGAGSWPTGLVIDATENDGWSPEQVTEDELNDVPLAGDVVGVTMVTLAS
jgi:hypothetical protein